MARIDSQADRIMRNSVASAANNVLIIAATSCVLLAGCSDAKPKRVPVAGTVLIDGKPLPFGSVQFVPEGARASGSAIDGNGRFVLSCYEPGDGAVVAKHRVRVTAAKNVTERDVRWEAPKKYADIKTSDLSVNVEGPTDALVINLSWGSGKPFVEHF